MSDEKTILGRPINGDVDKRYYKPVEQWGAEELVSHIDAVFEADPRIMAINWQQYTPYFNDGDPCEFGCHLNDDALVAYDKVPSSWYYDEAFDENDDEIETSTASYFSGRELEYTPGEGYQWVDVDKSAIPAAQAIQRLTENWKHFEDVCREHFGEHSRVIATRDGFNVEFYEHD